MTSAKSSERIDDEYFKSHVGITDTSNWLIPKRILMSAYPGDLDETKAKDKLIAILDAGIGTILCLQTKEELGRFKPYKDELVQLNDERTAKISLQFLSLQVPDCHIAEDELVESLVAQLVERYNRGENILIHCWGGHGRTGTIAAILYGKLRNISAEEALDHVGKCHKCRHVRKSRAPQTGQQHEQVKRLLQRQHET